MGYTKLYAGRIYIPDGKVDVTDPCYDKDVWCRTTVDVMPGWYNCYAYRGDDDGRIKRSMIVREGYDDPTHYISRVFHKCGEIGVDAGLAGFFHEKPDFGDAEWREICTWLMDSDNGMPSPLGTKHRNVYLSHKYHVSGFEGFFTSSNWGDGGYDVASADEDGHTVAVIIDFDDYE